MWRKFEGVPFFVHCSTGLEANLVKHQPPSQVTVLLQGWRGGDRKALDAFDSAPSGASYYGPARERWESGSPFEVQAQPNGGATEGFICSAAPPGPRSESRFAPFPTAFAVGQSLPALTGLSSGQAYLRSKSGLLPGAPQ